MLPEVGAVIEMDGGVVSPTLLVTVRVAVAEFPAASRAVNVSTFAPGWIGIATDQLDGLVANPVPPLSLLHATCDTPTLSLAVPLMVTVVLVVEYVPLLLGDTMAIVGPWLSGAVPPVAE